MPDDGAGAGHVLLSIDFCLVSSRPGGSVGVSRSLRQPAKRLETGVTFSSHTRIGIST
jgi:hypothetical protein